MSDQKNDETDTKPDIPQSEPEPPKPDASTHNTTDFINTLSPQDPNTTTHNDQKTIFDNSKANNDQLEEKTIFCAKKHEDLKHEVRSGLNYIFEETATCYKFVENNWENIGKGSFRITVYEGKKRVIFVLENTIAVYIDFVVQGQMNSEVKGNNLVMYCYGERSGAYCFRFDNGGNATRANNLVISNE